MKLRKSRWACGDAKFGERGKSENGGNFDWLLAVKESLSPYTAVACTNGFKRIRIPNIKAQNG